MSALASSLAVNVATALALVTSIVALVVLAQRRRREQSQLDGESLAKTRETERTQVTLVHAARQSTLTRIASGVAHEVNNPAGLILANLEHLRQRIDPRDDVGLRAIDDSLEGIRRIRTIVSALNALTRDDDVAIEAVNLSAVVDTALQVGAPSIPRGVEIVRELEAIEAFEGRPGTVMRIVLDLVADAAERVPRNVSGRIVVATRREGDLALIDVLDEQGPMAPGEQCDARLVRLEVVRQSVRTMSGVLSISPRDELGISRTVRFPMKIIAPPPEPVVAVNAAPRRASVLLIDNEPTLLRVLGRVIARVHDVHAARSGEEAVALMRQHVGGIDLVVCDVILADTNGLTLRATLGEIDAMVLDRFVFMTGGGLSPELTEQLSQLACPVLEKPLEPAELLSCIARTLARRK